MTDDGKWAGWGVIAIALGNLVSAVVVLVGLVGERIKEWWKGKGGR